MLKKKRESVNIANYTIPNYERLNKKVLSEEDCIELRRLFFEEDYTYSMLSSKFGISKNIIYFTLYPEKRVAYNEKQRLKKVKDVNNIEKCRRYRERKRSMLVDGMLYEKEEKEEK